MDKFFCFAECRKRECRKAEIEPDESSAHRLQSVGVAGYSLVK
jgi:hypothetical protein